MHDRVTPSTKLLLIVGLNALPVSIFAARRSQSIWPGIPFAVGAVTLVTIFLVARGHTRPVSVALAGIVFVGVFYRLAIYLYPSSMIGIDPDGYAIAAEQIIQAGHSGYLTSNFYSQVPLFPVYSAIASIVSGLPATDGMVIFPLLVGVVLCLFAYLIGRVLATPTAGLVAASLAAVFADISISGYLPIPQTMAALFIVVFIYVMQRYFLASGGGEEQRYAALLMVLMLAMALTHRLPLFLLALVIGALLIASKMPGVLPLPDKSSVSTKRQSLYVLGALTFCLFIAQLVYLTTYISAFVLSLALLLGDFSPASPPVTTAPDAVQVYAGLEWAIVRRLHAFTMLAVGGFSWLGALYYWRDQSSATPYLVVTGVLFMLFPLSLIATDSIRYTRLQRMIAPFLAAVIAATLIGQRRRWTPTKQSVATGLSMVILTVLIVTQLTTPAAAPDNPLSSRMYLTGDEVTAKEFGHSYAPQAIQTDDFYAGEEPYPRRAVLPDGLIDQERASGYQSFQDRMFTAGFLEDCPENVLYRHNVDIYRYSGSWRLTWDMAGKLEATYSKPYSNGGVSLYTTCAR